MRRVLRMAAAAVVAASLLFVWVMGCGVLAHVVNHALEEHDLAPAGRAVR